MKLGIVKVKLEREVNAYVITCASTKEAVVIDPGLPADKLADQVKDLKVKFIVATHCHPGHVAGKDDLKELTGGQTAIHTADAKQFLRSMIYDQPDQKTEALAAYEKATELYKKNAYTFVYGDQTMRWLSVCPITTMLPGLSRNASAIRCISGVK